MRRGAAPSCESTSGHNSWQLIELRGKKTPDKDQINKLLQTNRFQMLFLIDWILNY